MVKKSIEILKLTEKMKYQNLSVGLGPNDTIKESLTHMVRIKENSFVFPL